MKIRTLRELLLYNYRYWFGYAMIIGFVFYFLGWKINTYPLGLHQFEITTAAGNLGLKDILTSPIYPLHSILQWASITLFDINTLTLRAPGLIISLLTVLTLYKLLRRWFGKPTAIIGTTLFVSADWFLFIARLGTGAIEFSLWLALALLCLTKLMIEKKTLWIVPLAGAISMLLFAPFGIVAAITIAVVMWFYKIFQTKIAPAKQSEKIIAGALIALSAIGWVAASFHSIEFLKAMFGIQNLPTISGYFTNILNNLGGIVATFPGGNPMLGPTGTFFVRFFELIFIIFGAAMLWRTRVNRLNLLVLALSVTLALTSGLSSGSRGSGLMLILASVYVTAGLRHLLHRWQRTFPKNPYARMVAYAPIGVLIICTVSLHYANYFILWQNQPQSRSIFTRDYELLKNELTKVDYIGRTCAVQSTNEPFNKLLLAAKPQCEIHFTDDTSGTEANYHVVRASAPQARPRESQIKAALVSEATQDSTRWLVVEKY